MRVLSERRYFPGQRIPPVTRTCHTFHAEKILIFPRVPPPPSETLIKVIRSPASDTRLETKQQFKIGPTFAKISENYTLTLHYIQINFVLLKFYLRARRVRLREGRVGVQFILFESK